MVVFSNGVRLVPEECRADTIDDSLRVTDRICGHGSGRLNAFTAHVLNFTEFCITMKLRILSIDARMGVERLTIEHPVIVDNRGLP